MPPSVALCVCVLFVGWLFWSDAKKRQKTSGALWIPLTWALIISSRPVSLWLGGGDISINADGSLDDRLLDRAIFAFLILGGLLVLARRAANWPNIVSTNRWLFIYFLYLGLSVLWSDNSFVSFKRWVKDFGNIIMVLVVLSEKDPVEALKAFLARYVYLVVPASVLVIKYFQGISRRYDLYSDQAVFIGLTLDKNTLGMTLFVSGLSLLWLTLESRERRVSITQKTVRLQYFMLLLMTGWLLLKANSATALACTLLGGCILLGIRVSAIRKQVKWLEGYALGLAILVLFSQISGLSDALLQRSAGAFGRDATLHGRADIWQAVLKEDINPLIGEGFYSFWSLERNQRLSERFYYSLGTAHNGYLETYLNSGLIGLALLGAVIASAIVRIKRDVVYGSNFGKLRLAFLVAILVYNVTESTFDRLSPVWFISLLVMVEFPRAVKRTSPIIIGHRASGLDTQITRPIEIPG